MALAHIRGTLIPVNGCAQYSDLIKGVATRSQVVTGIAVGDKIVKVTRLQFGATVGLFSTAFLTAAQFSVSAANTVYKKGTPASFPGMILIVNWVDQDGGLVGV